MTKLSLSPDLKLPPDAVTQTFAILAMRGAGKTYTASVFAEELSEAGLPFAVLDPTGAWYGLRSSADGKSDGYPVTILGGDHADAPLEETAGKVIADLLAEEAPPLILDMSRLSKSAMRRFVADFAERLYEKNRNPLHLIIDEADAFTPQKPRPDEMRMLGAIDEIVRRGRIRGLGCTLVTQRSAVLNKDVLTQTEVLVVLRTAHPRDRAPVLEWMKVHATDEQLAAVEESLAKLPKGDAWVMSAGWLDLFARVHIRERRTFNSSATPEPGRRMVTPRKLAPVDLKLLQERMAETLERAKATDPKLLQRRIAELEREREQALKMRDKVADSYLKEQGKEKRVEVPVLKDSQIAALAKIAEHLDSMFNKFADRQLAMHTTATAIVNAIGNTRNARPSPHSLPAHRAPPPRPAAPRRPPPARQTEERPESEMGKGERIVLTATAQHTEGVTREQLTVLTGYKRSTRDTYLQRLRERGFVAEQGDRIGATAEGIAILGPDYEPLPTGAALLDHWRHRLPQGEAAVLEIVVAAWPEPVDREAISEATEYQRSSRDTYLQRLRSRQLVLEAGRGQVRASDTLFNGAIP